MIEPLGIHAALIEDSKQTNTAHRETVRGNNPVSRRKTDFDTAAADVHQQSRFSLKPNGIPDSQVNEPRLLIGFDEVEINAITRGNQGCKLFPVLRFTNRTGGDSFEARHVVLVEQFTKASESVQCGLHCFRSNSICSENVMPQTNRFSGYMDSGEVASGRNSGNSQPDGITSNVNRSNIHE